jgi:serine phosphatase RsbU (regulator of sigma subunit)
LQTKAEKPEVEAKVEECGAESKPMKSRAFGAKALSALMVILLLAEVALSILASVPLPAQAQAQQQQLPRVALVKLWSVSHAAYMAKFVGEDYVVVFDSHGDVSLDGRFISA